MSNDNENFFGICAVLASCKKLWKQWKMHQNAPFQVEIFNFLKSRLPDHIACGDGILYLLYLFPLFSFFTLNTGREFLKHCSLYVSVCALNSERPKPQTMLKPYGHSANSQSLYTRCLVCRQYNERECTLMLSADLSVVDWCLLCCLMMEHRLVCVL